MPELNWLAGDDATQFRGKPKLQMMVGAGAEALRDRKVEFDRVLTLLKGKTVQEFEIIATLFAAWNDTLLDKRVVADQLIIDEVLENWHESKKERFRPAQLARWLDWMRQNGLVPKGVAPRTKQQRKLI